MENEPKKIDEPSTKDKSAIKYSLMAVAVLLVAYYLFAYLPRQHELETKQQEIKGKQACATEAEKTARDRLQALINAGSSGAISLRADRKSKEQVMKETVGYDQSVYTELYVGCLSRKGLKI